MRLTAQGFERSLIIHTHTVQRSLFIEAPVETVWESVGDFAEQVSWLPGSGNFDWNGEPNTPGAERIIHSSGDVVVRERLNYRDHDAHRIGYSMVESPFPLTGHEATLEVSSHADGSMVTWTATFQAEDDDAREVESMMGTQTFEPGLQSLGKYIQQRQAPQAPSNSGTPT